MLLTITQVTSQRVAQSVVSPSKVTAPTVIRSRRPTTASPSVSRPPIRPQASTTRKVVKAAAIRPPNPSQPTAGMTRPSTSKPTTIKASRPTDPTPTHFRSGTRGAAR